MDKIVTATEANRDFSRLLNQVAAGETFVVTSRGKPVARLEPAGARTVTPEQKAARLKALKVMRQRPIRDIGTVTRDDGYV
jgi:prevent-host-death family protein